MYMVTYTILISIILMRQSSYKVVEASWNCVNGIYDIFLIHFCLCSRYFSPKKTYCTVIEMRTKNNDEEMFLVGRRMYCRALEDNNCWKSFWSWLLSVWRPAPRHPWPMSDWSIHLCPQQSIQEKLPSRNLLFVCLFVCWKSSFLKIKTRAEPPGQQQCGCTARRGRQASRQQ